MAAGGISVAALVLGAAGVSGVTIFMAVPRVFGPPGVLGVSDVTGAVHALVSVLATSAPGATVSQVPHLSWVLLLPSVS